MTFNETGLKPELLEAIQELGYVNPTPIQEQTIPFLLENQQDLIALAQTGTGKTAAFSLPVLEQIDIEDKTVQALILCPTRELCLQIAKDIESYTTKLRSLKTLAVYGGTPAYQQKKQLKRGAHIVVGTPGRTLDLIRQRALDVRKIKWLTLDEADEMLNMGFKDDLESILSNTPDDKQTLLFSATMPREMKGIVNEFMTNPHRIQVAKQNIGSSNVEHHFYVAKAKDRFAALRRLVDAHPDMYAIIFCRTRRETQQIADDLMAFGYNADTIHGDLSQAQRDNVMKNFKNKTLQMLVATDVAARGIDVDELTHVINYQLPDDPEVYVHRSGRTGRAGNKGISICLINTREGKRLSTIEKMIGKEFVKQSLPSGKDICTVQVKHFLKQINTHEAKGNLLEEYWSIIEEEIGNLNSDEIINRLLSIEISKFLKIYQNAPNLDASARSTKRSDRDSDKRGGRRSAKNWVGYQVNIGSKERMQPKRLIALVNEQTDSNDIPIGEIIVKNKSTYFEVAQEDAQRLEEAFEGLEYNSDGPFLEKADRKPEPTQRSKRGGARRQSNSRDEGNRRSSRGGNRSRGGSSSRGKRRNSGKRR